MRVAQKIKQAAKEEILLLLGRRTIAAERGADGGALAIEEWL
jgi:hypothetical protein